MKAALAAVLKSEPLPDVVLQEAFFEMLSGRATPAQVGGFLVGLAMRPEHARLLVSAARSLREHCVAVKLGPKPVVLDTCGTGGDGSNTFNISTAASLVIAACDVPVAKHGNRAATSRVGSADVLEALGVKIDLSADEVASCIENLGIGFMLARVYHPSVQHVAAARTELGVPTIFNMLGPLSNPASASHHVVGVARAEMLMPFAQALAELGSKRAWVVHGDAGLDELSLGGPSKIVELDHGALKHFTVHPRDFGLAQQARADLTVSSVSESASIIRAVLRGDAGPARDVVILNAAAGLLVSGRAATYTEAAQLAARTIDSGAAADKLARWATATQSV